MNAEHLLPLSGHMRSSIAYNDIRAFVARQLKFFVLFFSLALQYR